MGDPRKQRSKFSTPNHPWERARIDEERELKREYGFKNKREIWKMSSIAKNFSSQAKKLAAIKTVQGEKEKIQLMNKLILLGLLPENASLDNVLDLSVKDIAGRRLQSIVFRKGLANSMKQARQFISHEHISVGGKKITSPSYLVSKEEENLISFAQDSGLTDEMHPERAKKQEMPKKAEKKEVAPKEKKKEIVHPGKHKPVENK